MLFQIYFILVILLPFPEHCHSGLSPTLTPSQMRTTENDSLSLTCTTNGVALSYVILTVNDNRVVLLQTSGCSSFIQFNTTLYEYQCINTTTFVFKVKIVTNNYHGNYIKCGLSDTSAYTYSNPVVVFVVVPVSSVTMTTPQETAITVIQNTTIEFVCNTSVGRPQPMIRWLKFSGTSSNTINGIEIASGVMQPSPMRDDEYVSTKGTLTYQASKDNNGSRIYCTANNTASHVISSNKPVLNILYPPTVNNALNISVVEGFVAFVDCLITPGNRAQANYTWTRKKDSWNQRNQRMYISHVTSEDAGLYECTAQNYMQPTVGSLQIGKSSNSFYLEVLPDVYVQTPEPPSAVSRPIGAIVGGTVAGVIVTATQFYPPKDNCKQYEDIETGQESINIYAVLEQKTPNKPYVYENVS